MEPGAPSGGSALARSPAWTAPREMHYGRATSGIEGGGHGADEALQAGIRPGHDLRLRFARPDRRTGDGDRASRRPGDGTGGRARRGRQLDRRSRHGGAGRRRLLDHVDQPEHRWPGRADQHRLQCRRGRPLLGRQRQRHLARALLRVGAGERVRRRCGGAGRVRGLPRGQRPAGHRLRGHRLSGGARGPGQRESAVHPTAGRGARAAAGRRLGVHHRLHAERAALSDRRRESPDSGDPDAADHRSHADVGGSERSRTGSDARDRAAGHGRARDDGVGERRGRRTRDRSGDRHRLGRSGRRRDRDVQALRAVGTDVHRARRCSRARAPCSSRGPRRPRRRRPS